MQEQPHPVRLVERHLDEVVARPSEPSCSGQCGECDGPRRPIAAQLLEFRDPSAPRSSPDPSCCRGRPTAGDSRAAADACSCSTRRSPAGQVAGVELGADGDHPAADVDADRRRDDRAVGRDHRADGRALAQVRVGHQRHVRVDERHRRGFPRLCKGGVVDVAGKVQQVVAVLGGGHCPTPVVDDRAGIARGVVRMIGSPTVERFRDRASEYPRDGVRWIGTGERIHRTVVGMTGHDDWSRNHGATALRRHAPEVASTLDRLVALVPPIGDGSVVARAREVCGRTLSLPPLPAPPVASAPANADGTTQVRLEFRPSGSAPTCP